MCGIIGVTSSNNVQDYIIASLKRLEYRGYDSSGIATVSDKRLKFCKAEGKINNLIKKLKDNPLKGFNGIGHTRWATHGNVSEDNAHPHISGKVAIVHNGIIENFQEIKDKLSSKGRIFNSQTDSEVIAHLFDYEFSKNKSKKEATQNVLKVLKGAYAFVVLDLDDPNTLIAARNASPLAIGTGDKTNSVGSDAIALAGIAKQIIFLEDGDFAILNDKHINIFDLNGNSIKREVKPNSLDPAVISKGNYRHFMQKEIYEQPETISHTISEMYNSDGKISKNLSEIIGHNPKSITILAAGTSYYAGLIGKYWIESLAEIPVNVEIASEFRYRKPFIDPDGLIITISQSGESIDTLMAMRYAQASGIKSLSIINSIGSTIDRESDYSIFTRAGAEIAVASTKAFTAQLISLLSICLAFAERKQKNLKEIDTIKSKLFKIPGAVAKALSSESKIIDIASNIVKSKSCLYLGRGPLFPLALEGALKLKEVSYIHAEGFSAGEMKHGPIALIEEGLPVISLLANDYHSLKTVSNLREALARGAKLIIFADEGAENKIDFAHEILKLPFLHETITPIIASIPIQLLAYHTAVAKGTDVDQPKNLAKSVTVE
ncbi:MAG: glutamine--fructose-6-phosphate transaminase (isomerizing) [SAR116 cluster bacterium]|nr:glutamine--fructose-6-phosphate transaminase (isomerizing) [SAR116 cluster bacterium]